MQTAFAIRVSRALAMSIASLGIVTFGIGGRIAEGVSFTHGQINVQGTGYGVDEGVLVEDPERLSRNQLYESERSIFATDEITSYSYPSSDLATTYSSAGIRSKNGDLGAYAIARHDFGSARAHIGWSDSVQLLPPPDSVPPEELPFSISTLKIYFDVHGSLATSKSPSGSFVSTQFDFFFNNQNLMHESIQSISEDPDDKYLPIERRVVGQLELVGGSADFSYFLDTLSQSGGGTANSQFFNTINFSSITFEDGSTPESHGYTLLFASGMPSPNLTLGGVPEPSGLLLNAMGAVALLFPRMRRNKFNPGGKAYFRG